MRSRLTRLELAGCGVKRGLGFSKRELGGRRVICLVGVGSSKETTQVDERVDEE